MQRTGFANACTHLSERQAKMEHLETSLCAALVAEAGNIGTKPVSQNFIRPETIAAANARIAAAHGALPLVKL